MWAGFFGFVFYGVFCFVGGFLLLFFGLFWWCFFVWCVLVLYYCSMLVRCSSKFMNYIQYVILKVNTGDCWPSNGNDCNGLLYSWVEIPFTKSNGLELISLDQLLYIHTLVVLWLLGVKVSAVLNCLRHLQLITWHIMIEEGAFSWEVIFPTN